MSLATSDGLSRSRSRSAHRVSKKQRKPLGEQALEQLVTSRLSKWLPADSEEIKLLAQFCATMAHSEENWQKEIKEEVSSFLLGDTEDFVNWLEQNRWCDEIDQKFGKQALKLKQRALDDERGSATTSKPIQRLNPDSRASKKNSLTSSSTAATTPSVKVEAKKTSNNYGQSHSSYQKGSRQSDDLETVQIGFNSSSTYTASSSNLNAGKNNRRPLLPQPAAVKMKVSPSMAVATYDYTKDEYQNLTLDNDQQGNDKAEQRRVLDAGRKKLLEQNTKILQRVLVKLNDPNNSEKQKEQLAAMISKIKAQMAAVKPPEVPRPQPQQPGILPPGM